MGRLTPSFRTVYSEVLDDLRKEMRNCFVDVIHKDAFDLLYKGPGARKKSNGKFYVTNRSGYTLYGR